MAFIHYSVDGHPASDVEYRSATASCCSRTASRSISGGGEIMVKVEVSLISTPHARRVSILIPALLRCSSAIQNNSPAHLDHNKSILRHPYTTLRLRRLYVRQSTRHGLAASLSGVWGRGEENEIMVKFASPDWARSLEAQRTCAPPTTMDTDQQDGMDLFNSFRDVCCAGASLSTWNYDTFRPGRRTPGRHSLSMTGIVSSRWGGPFVLTLTPLAGVSKR